ncbi:MULTISPECIES: DUF998 domain-containing protein [Aquimarina]|uniref:DUF998 domain-containing protein n=1 Tax=Aquimarina TaxID=290174 RepID=UPI00040651C9|nr:MULTISPECIES: DUF998 domain-containing protein [Aquimarina]
MNNKITFFIGILGVSLFVVSSILGGFLIENYNIFSQYISESYAIDTKYGIFFRIFGYIPSGILIALFCFLGVRYFPPSKLLKIGFRGIGIFYGLATVVVGIFPCDSGCNKELIDPSSSQLIHNFVGILTYLFVPVFMILIGFELKKGLNNTFSLQSIVFGAISMLLVYILVSNSKSEYIGLYQRMVELVFVIWVIFCAIVIKNKKPISNKGYN